MRLALAGLACAAFLCADVIDRIAITIDYQTITESQIDEDLRVTALLNHQPIPHDEAARRNAADRIVQQYLLKREMELSGFMPPDKADNDAYLKSVEQEISSAGGLTETLDRYHLTEATLRSHLALQLMTLRFIDFRFRPDQAVTAADMRSYVERNSSAAFDRAALRKLIIEERTDTALNTWLEEARKRFNIVYLDHSLQ